MKNEFWNGIKNEIETINSGEASEHDNDSIKIKFNSDDNLPLNKTLKLHNTTIVIRSVFEKDGNFYLQDDAISITNNSNLTDKKGVLYIFFYYI